jgi:hypothetical protein
VIILTSLTLVTGVVYHQIIINQLHDWKVLPQPEAFTELYFDNHATLPRTYRGDDAQIVSFVIHSHERQKRTYQYRIIQQDAARETAYTLVSDTVTLGQGSMRQVSAHVTLKELGGRSRITVEVTPGDQEIGYWLEREDEP